MAVERIGRAKPLTFTHGDNGSGNYLGNGVGGVIPDWENATITPSGVDIGLSRDEGRRATDMPRNGLHSARQRRLRCSFVGDVS
jgi:hypothetical protein